MPSPTSTSSPSSSSSFSSLPPSPEPQTYSPIASTKSKPVSLMKNRPSSVSTRKETKSLASISTAPTELPHLLPSHLEDEDELKPGRLVAAQIAKVKRQQQWILARVVRYLRDKKKYEVEDEDPGDDLEHPVRKHYTVGLAHILALPKGDANDPEYPKDTMVFAVFPNTTTFYTAIVAATPSKKKKNGEYMLRFADDEDEQGHTPTRKVPVGHVVQSPMKL